jgi:predicted deacylase
MACGIPEMIALEPLPGRLLTAMADLGVPLIEGEVGGRGRTTAGNVDYYHERVIDVARFAGIVGDSAGALPGVARQTWRLGSIESSASGIFVREAQLGQSISTGDRLGVIRDSTGRVVAEVLAPVAATIGGFRDHAGVTTGDTLFNLWLPVDA